MDIIISNASDAPIYEQIREQIASQILNGELGPGTSLPSIRLLAKDLKISVITTKRAYTELERQGLIETVPGKGSFVASINPGLIREKQLELISENVDNIVTLCKQYDVSKDELLEILDILWQ
ncbi:GntR family transcriptional regulator [Vallitalea okinawensis]|uniref:GntR family transcriptional regulator n=1 Tax=Vallitalea okinawensis TaxID=2078660 RepID=UPI000CFB6D8F|nr:GntR family transcriptional regulator [Vallitalea okinawensis]